MRQNQQSSSTQAHTISLIDLLLSPSQQMTQCNLFSSLLFSSLLFFFFSFSSFSPPSFRVIARECLRLFQQTKIPVADVRGLGIQMDLLENEHDPNHSSNSLHNSKNTLSSLDRFLQRQPSEAVRLLQEKTEPSLPQTAQEKAQEETKSVPSLFFERHLSVEKKEKEEKREKVVVAVKKEEKKPPREIVIVDDDDEDDIQVLSPSSLSSYPLYIFISPSFLCFSPIYFRFSHRPLLHLTHTRSLQTFSNKPIEPKQKPIVSRSNAPRLSPLPQSPNQQRGRLYQLCLQHLLRLGSRREEEDLL